MFCLLIYPISIPEFSVSDVVLFSRWEGDWPLSHGFGSHNIKAFEHLQLFDLVKSSRKLFLKCRFKALEKSIRLKALPAAEGSDLKSLRRNGREFESTLISPALSTIFKLESEKANLFLKGSIFSSKSTDLFRLCI